MGLLDDAIREHLELKRRRGADPTEVEQLAREALGPVRRAPHDGDELPLGDEQATGVAHGNEGVEQASEPSGEEGPLFDRAYEEEGYPAEPEQHLKPENHAEPAPGPEYGTPRHHEIAEDWEAQQSQQLHGEGAGLEPAAHAPSVPPPAAPPAAEEPPATGAPAHRDDLDAETVEHEIAHGGELGEETAEHDMEAELGDPEGEDVLEETPEFLQDTPDHDRLWFEQRPPRDFDFDG